MSPEDRVRLLRAFQQIFYERLLFQISDATLRLDIARLLARGDKVGFSHRWPLMLIVPHPAAINQLRN